MKFVKLLFIVILVILYWIFFGKDSFDRYLDGSTTITKTIETDTEIEMPVIKLGFQFDAHQKNITFENIFDKFLSGTSNATEEEVSNILKEIANEYLFQIGYNSTHTDIKQSYVFVNNEEGLNYLTPKSGYINTSACDSLGFSFNPDKTLHIFIADLNFISPFINPSSTVETYLALDGERKVGYVIYLKAIRHIKINRKGYPCKDSTKYNYADCINEKLMKKVGCQPHWFYKKEDPLPLCSNFSQFNFFLEKYSNILDFNHREIYQNLSCQKPCKFMEYKFVKQTPAPTVLEETKAMIKIVFESNDIEVEKEVYEFPFSSLVADVGGILGLFIGFNFLIIWDFIDVLLNKMKIRLCNILSE